MRDVHGAVTDPVPSQSALQLLHRELCCETLSSAVCWVKLHVSSKSLSCLMIGIVCIAGRWVPALSSFPATCSVQKWPCSHLTSSVTALGPETNRCDWIQIYPTDISDYHMRKGHVAFELPWRTSSSLILLLKMKTLDIFWLCYCLVMQFCEQGYER